MVTNVVVCRVVNMYRLGLIVQYGAAAGGGGGGGADADAGDRTVAAGRPARRAEKRPRPDAAGARKSSSERRSMHECVVNSAICSAIVLALRMKITPPTGLQEGLRRLHGWQAPKVRPVLFRV